MMVRDEIAGICVMVFRKNTVGILLFVFIKQKNDEKLIDKMPVKCCLNNSDKISRIPGNVN